MKGEWRAVGGQRIGQNGQRSEVGSVVDQDSIV